MARSKCVISFCHEITRKDGSKQLFGITTFRNEEVGVISKDENPDRVVREKGVYLCETINPQFRKPLFERNVDKHQLLGFFTIEVIKKLEVRKSNGIDCLIFDKSPRAVGLFLEEAKKHNLIIYYNRYNECCEIYSLDPVAFQRILSALVRQQKNVKIVKEHNTSFIVTEITRRNTLEQIESLCLESYCTDKEIKESMIA